MRNNGFSVIELVAIMLIIGIIAAVSIPRMVEKQPFDLQKTTDSLLQDMRLTQLLAMSMNETYRIDINTNGHQIFSSSGAYSHPISGTSQTLAGSGISISPTLSISFDLLGTPNIGGTPLASNQTFTISDSSSTKSILLRAQTGFASEN